MRVVVEEGNDDGVTPRERRHAGAISLLVYP